MKSKTFYIILMLFMIASACKKDDKKDTTFNIFSVDDDIAFGEELKNEIHSNPGQYPLLDRSQYDSAYFHLKRIRDSILSTGKLIYGDRFSWDIDIIHDDSVLNAFCAPGGYICVYTGIIKFLDNEAQLAGVMGHEMAHADRRHSTDQLTKAYGLQILLGILIGNNAGQLTQIAADLAAGVATLAFSRDAEYEADEYSVRYLCPTAYDAEGVGGFFEKMTNSPHPPEFLSTHPNPENRLEQIHSVASQLDCGIGKLFAEDYQNIKSSLP